MSQLLEVKDLIVRFNMLDGVVHAVNGVSFSLAEGETLGIVGESGCGKSVSVLSLLRLIPEPPGEIVRGTAIFRERDLLQSSTEQLHKVRGAEIAMIFQDPMTSLNPVLTIGGQVAEALSAHFGMSRGQVRHRTVELLNLVGIPNAEARLDDYPHQFSGGMRQRVMIAMALACDPKILIADEPTTALDVTIQAQIIRLVKRLRQDLGMAIIWITHDLGIIAGIAQRVIVMYAGFVVEHAPVKELYANPQHPYTVSLLGSVPRMGAKGTKRLASIEGVPPDMLTAPTGCPFAPRCAYAFDRCRAENPGLLPIRDGHSVACWWDLNEGQPRDDD